MSPRKPPAERWESWVDRQIREAEERGEFDDLPGRGKPLPDLDQPYDELWWIRKKLKDENVAYLPPALKLRREVEEAREHIAAAASEDEVREIVATVNAHIRTVTRGIIRGPRSTVALLDEERTVELWRARRDDRRRG